MTDYPHELVLHDHVQQCRDKLLAAQRNRNRVAVSVQAAEAALQEATLSRDDVVLRAASFGGVPVSESISAHQSVRDCEGHVTIMRESLARAEGDVAIAQTALNKAGGASHQPVLEHAIDRRIELAARLGEMQATVAEILTQYDFWGNVAAQAQAHGARAAAQPILSRSPFGRLPAEHGDAERAAWGRPPRPPEPVAAE